MKQATDTKHQTAKSIDEGGADCTNGTPLKKVFIEAYRANAGNTTEACAAVGIGRRTFYNWKNSDSEFAAAIASVDESLIDKAESKLMELINKGDKTAIIFFLKTKGKERGYIERTETETYNMTPVDFAEQAIENERAKRASN